MSTKKKALGHHLKMASLLASTPGQKSHSMASPMEQTASPDHKQRLDQAFNLFQQGKTDEALQSIKQLLLLDQNNVMLLNLAAVCSIRLDLPEQAEKYWQQALVIQPDFADAHYNLAILLKDQKRYLDSETSYLQALAIRPNYAEVHNNLGNLYQELKRHEEARTCYQKALYLKPDFAEAMNNLGILLQRMNCPQEADASFRQALAIQPNYISAFNNLAMLLKTTHRIREAENCYRQALRIQPNDVETLVNFAQILHEQKRWAEADAVFKNILHYHPKYIQAYHGLAQLLKDQKRYAEAEQILRIGTQSAPENADILISLGHLLHEQKLYDKAEAIYRQALKLQPRHANGLNSLGNLMQEQKRLPEAEEKYRAALRVQPEHPFVHNNLGNLLLEMNRHDEAEQAYREALRLLPTYADAAFNLSMMLLAVGKFTEGWAWHEMRYHPSREQRKTILPNLPFPMWQGENLAGKSLLIVPEQGYGDQIQFCRFVPLLIKMGVRHLVLACHTPLKPLFTTLAYVDQVIAWHETMPPPIFDYWIFPLSLPHRLNITLDTIPATIPYLWPLPKRITRFRDLLPQLGMRVGLVWKGSYTHMNDSNRSLAHLSLLAPLWSIPWLFFISLQKGTSEDEAINPHEDQPILHLGHQIDDFADTAAIVSQLDLIICVDTSIAHLAGALGKPVWLMLPFSADWRWLSNTNHSPWYPTMRLFRQKKVGDWHGVIQEIAKQLLMFIP